MIAESLSPEISDEARRPFCCPEQNSRVGFGYLGGGFGPYRRCNGCGAVFGKTSARDGNPEPMREAGL